MLYASRDQQSYLNDSFDALTKISIEATKKLMAISVAISDYTKNSIEISLTYVDNTSNSKTVEDLLNAQTEVIKSTFDELLALITKFEKLYVDVINSDTPKHEITTTKKIPTKKTLIKNTVNENNITTSSDTYANHSIADEKDYSEDKTVQNSH